MIDENTYYAFPMPSSVDACNPEVSYPAHSGMSLRDYFAAKAMTTYTNDFSYVEAAKFSYEMADAMIKARQQ